MSVISTASPPAAANAPRIDDAANALPAGHCLHEFELRGVIGVGGFGIVYRAFDHSLEREVAIKEYLPAALAGRSGKLQVSLLSAAHSETFALGMSSFVNEAKLLARFDHPSLLKVHRFWEDNGTAYMVMPLYRGVTLRQLRHDTQRCPDGAWLLQLTVQLLGALDVLHHEGVFHRDIAPDNVIVADGAPPVLLDFGAARRVISDRSQTLTAILKPSYAPLEQYAESNGMRQGPWTDFYALGATLHYVITGKPPVPATARALSDDQPSLAGARFGDVPDLLLRAVDWMLAPRPHDRPQNVAELQAALAGRLPIPQRERASSEQLWQTTLVQGGPGSPAAAAMPDVRPAAPRHRRRIGRVVPLWGAAAAMAVTAALGAWWASDSDDAAPPPVAQAAQGVIGATVVAAAPVPGATANGDNAAAPVADAPIVAPVRATPPRDSRAAEKKTSTTSRPAAQRTTRPVAVAPVTAVGSAGAVPTATTEVNAPGHAPVSVAQVTRNPRESCRGRHLLALHRCLVRECEKPEFQAHRECQRTRDIEARARSARGE